MYSTGCQPLVNCYLQKAFDKVWQVEPVQTLLYTCFEFHIKPNIWEQSKQETGHQTYMKSAWNTRIVCNLVKIKDTDMKFDLLHDIWFVFRGEGATSPFSPIHFLSLTLTENIIYSVYIHTIYFGVPSTHAFNSVKLNILTSISCIYLIF